MSSKAYVVLLSGTNITADGRTGTYNAGMPVPEGADNIEHLLEVKCIGEVGEHSDFVVSSQIVGSDVGTPEPEPKSKRAAAESSS